MKARSIGRPSVIGRDPSRAKKASLVSLKIMDLGCERHLRPRFGVDADGDGRRAHLCQRHAQGDADLEVVRRSQQPVDVGESDVDDNDDKRQLTRRRLMTTLAVSGAAAPLVLPNQWARPVIDMVVVPAHEQSSR